MNEEKMPDPVESAQKRLRQAVFATIPVSEPLRVMQVQAYNNLSLRAAFQALLTLLIKRYGISQGEFSKLLARELEEYARLLVDGAGLVVMPDGSVVDLKAGTRH